MSDYQIFTASNTFLLFGYFALRGNSERQNSWVLTLLSSGILSINSIFMLPLSDRALIIFFLIYLILDTIFALSIYPQKKKESEGTFLHHISYIALCLFALHKGYTGALVAAFPLEIPTFFLALGHVFPFLCVDDSLTCLLWYIFMMIYIIFFLLPRDSDHLYLLILVIRPLILYIHWLSCCVEKLAPKKRIM